MAGRTTEKPFKMLLGVISATNMPVSSLGCFCIMYLGRRIMVGGPPEGGGNHVGFRSKIKYPNSQSQLIWNEQFLVGVRDPTVEILSVCVKSQHMMHTPTVAACAIELKVLKLDELVDQNVALYMGPKRAGHIRLRIQLSHNEKYIGVARPVVAVRGATQASAVALKSNVRQQEPAKLQNTPREVEQQEERKKQQAKDQELQVEREVRMLLEQQLARQSALQEEREKRLALELELERLRNANGTSSSRRSISKSPDNQIAHLVGAFANANMASQELKHKELEIKLPPAVDPLQALPIDKPPSYAQIFPTCDRRSATSCGSQSERTSVGHDELSSSDSSDSSRERRRRKARKKRKKAELLRRLMEKEKKKKLRRKARQDGRSENNSVLDSSSSDSSSLSSSSSSSGKRRRRKLKKKYKDLERRVSSTTSNSSGKRRYADETDRSNKSYDDDGKQDEAEEVATQPTRLCSIPPNRIPAPRNQRSSAFGNVSLSDMGKVAAGAAALYNVSCGGNVSSVASLLPIGKAIGKILAGSVHQHHTIVNDNSQDDLQIDDSYDADAVDTGVDWGNFGGDY